MIRWLSAPIRGFFNARFEAVRNDLRAGIDRSDLAIELVRPVESRLKQAEASLEAVLAAVAQLDNDLGERHDQLLHIVSVVGRDLHLLGERAAALEDAASEPDPSGRFALQLGVGPPTPLTSQELSTLPAGTMLLVIRAADDANARDVQPPGGAATASLDVPGAVDGVSSPPRPLPAHVLAFVRSPRLLVVVDDSSEAAAPVRDLDKNTLRAGEAGRAVRARKPGR